jgi:hypothetical protein
MLTAGLRLWGFFFKNLQMSCDVVMWRRPAMALLVLACGSLVYYHCGFRNHNLVSLISDVLFVITWSLAVLGLIFRSFNLTILPMDPAEWQVSPETANCIAATVANVMGALESVLRVAASGSDKKLFLKVVTVLYLLSAIGRSLAGATVAYALLWLVFTVPFCIVKLAPKSTSEPLILKLKEKIGTCG